MRRARHEDIEYFVQAGWDWCKHTPFTFDEEDYAGIVHALIDDRDCIAVVDGEPVRCHSVAKLSPSFYNAGEVIAKVFTTWGDGGLNCFVEVERLAKERGAKFLIADSFIAPRIIKFYERRDMYLTDSVFIKEL